MDFCIGYFISLKYIKHQGNFINVISLLLGTLVYISFLLAIIGVIWIMVDKFRKKEGKTEISLLKGFLAPRVYSLSYLLLMIITDSVLPMIFMFSLSSPTTQYVALAISVNRTLIQAAIGRVFVSKWIRIEETVNFAMYSIVLCFYFVLVFFGDFFSEELKYYMVGFPIIILILLSFTFYFTISVYQGGKAIKYFMSNIELPKEVTEPEVKIFAKEGNAFKGLENQENINFWGNRIKKKVVVVTKMEIGEINQARKTPSQKHIDDK